MTLDLAKLKALAEKALQPPWRWRKFGGEDVMVADHGPRAIVLSGAYTRNEKDVLEPAKPGMANTDFILALVNAFPALVARLEAAEAVLDRLFSRDPLSPADADLYDAWRRLTGGET
jgi:hypothetical protein